MSPTSVWTALMFLETTNIRIRHSRLCSDLFPLQCSRYTYPNSASSSSWPNISFLALSIWILAAEKCANLLNFAFFVKIVDWTSITIGTPIMAAFPRTRRWMSEGAELRTCSSMVLSDSEDMSLGWSSACFSVTKDSIRLTISSSSQQLAIFNSLTGLSVFGTNDGLLLLHQFIVRILLSYSFPQSDLKYFEYLDLPHAFETLLRSGDAWKKTSGCIYMRISPFTGTGTETKKISSDIIE